MAVQRLTSMAFCAGVLLAFAWAQPLGKGVISGTVVDGESGDPIRKAVVTLTLEAPHRWATTRTDGSGRFEFPGLPAGKYHLRATKANEGTAIYGAKSVRELGDLITLGDGEIRGDLKLRFLHSASISGHVYDSDGDPVANASVSLLRPGRNLGAPTLVNYRGSQSDDRGEYHFSNIDPGRYYLRAMPGVGRWMGGAVAGQGILGNQYYGGASEYKEASPIHVGGGENLSGLNFHLNSEPAVEVRGRIAGVPQSDEDMNGPQVTISPAETGSERWSTGTMAQRPDYRFQMPPMPAGRYRLQATMQFGGKDYGASQLIDLQPGLGEIVLTLGPAIDIQGTLRMEGQSPGSGNGLRVQLTRPGSPQGDVAEMGADGHFSIKGVIPGEWQLAVNPVPPGFLKLAQFGGKDVRFTTFEVGAGSEATLNIVVSMHTATVTGEVDADSSDSKRAGIVLAPMGEYHNLARYYYGVAADDAGKFKLRGIAPGKYKIFALEKMAAAGFRNPEAADQLDEFGEPIEIAEGVTLEAHPKLIPVARAAKVVE